MTIKKTLENLGITTFEYTNKKFQELKEQFLEMSQLKSNFDIEKFTVKKEGNFIAHNFHFLMRQYSLTLGELRRMLIEKEEKQRKIDECNELIEKGEKKILVYTREGKIEKYIDLYRDQLLNQLDLQEIGIADKAMRIIGFETCRLKLIELNGGKSPTNEQYQKEEPQYWKWFLEKKALYQLTQAKTGISEGIWENINYLEEKSLINPEFQVKMLENGQLNFDKIIENIELRKSTNKLLEDKDV